MLHLGPHPRAALGALLAVLTLACAPAAARASTYVDGASAGGACSDARSAAQAASPATPWCSLVTAAMKAPSGGTVLVRGGSYPYTRIDGAGRTAATATITMKAYPGETPVVTAVDIRNSSHLRFEGLRFSGTMNLVYFGNDHIEFVGNDLTNAVNIRGSRDILFDGNHFQSLGAEDVTIRGNIARDNDSGILNSSADHQTHGWTIENNVFARSSGTPLQLDNQMDDLVVANNTFTAGGVGVRPSASRSTAPRR